MNNEHGLWHISDTGLGLELATCFIKTCNDSFRPQWQINAVLFYWSMICWILVNNFLCDKICRTIFQTNIQSEHHRQNPWTPCPCTFSFLTFQNLPVFLLCSLLIASFIPLRLLYLNSQTISWRPLTPVKLQFLLLWICLRPLILWTMTHFSTDFSILLVYLVLLSPGFVHIWPTAHPLWKLTLHPRLPPPYSQACLRALFWVLFSSSFSYRQLQMS